MKYAVTDEGYYGNFGGAYIPEMLYPNVEELRERYLDIIAQPSFQEEFNELLKNFVGRPTPLFLAKRLSAKHKASIYLKREDLCHTGAHKVNNTIGQILVAKALGKNKIIAETGAGQHGVATATVCALMGMDCIVYMGKHDMERQRPNVERMRILGAKVVPALSGSMTLKDATNEAMRHWIIIRLTRITSLAQSLAHIHIRIWWPGFSPSLARRLKHNSYKKLVILIQTM